VPIGAFLDRDYGQVWDLRSGGCLHRLDGHMARVQSVAVSDDGARIVSGSFDHSIRIWNVHTGECVREIRESNDPIESVALTSNGKCVVAGAWSGRLPLWDVYTGRRIRDLEGHTDTVTCVSMSRDERRVISGGREDKTVRLWDLETGRAREFSKPPNWIESVALVPGDRLAVSAEVGSTIRL
jgi:WD40 repeat protein